MSKSDIRIGNPQSLEGVFHVLFWDNFKLLLLLLSWSPLLSLFIIIDLHAVLLISVHLAAEFSADFVIYLTSLQNQVHMQNKHIESDTTLTHFSAITCPSPSNHCTLINNSFLKFFFLACDIKESWIPG